MFAELRQGSARHCALTVAVVFAVIGAAWVLVTDILLYRFTSDAALLARIETAKGWAFVGLTAILLYVITLRSAGSLGRTQNVMSSIIDSIGDAVLLLGPDRNVQCANPAAISMLNTEELVGLKPAEFARVFQVSRSDGSRLRPEEFVSQRVFEGTGALTHKAVLHPRGRSQVVVSVTASPVSRATARDPLMVVSVLHDITAEEQFERLRDEFFAAAAHALKTPVTIIKMNAQALLAEEGAQSKESAAAIVRQCDRFDWLIQNLLVLGRIRSGTLQMHPESLELGPLVQQVAGKAGAAFERELRCESDQAPRIRADRERFSLALYNLIEEAVRSADSGSPITITAAADGADATVRIEYAPPPPHLRRVEEVLDAPDVRQQEVCIGRTVAATVIGAHAGTVRRYTDSVGEIRITIPAVESASGDSR